MIETRGEGRAVGTTTSATLMQVLSEIETRFPVMSWRVGEINIWPLARINWFHSRCNVTYRSSPTPPASGNLQKLALQGARLVRARLKRAIAAKSDPSGEASERGVRDAIFLSGGMSFVRRSNKWYERFCDPLITSLGDQGFSSVLLTLGYSYLNPRWTPSRFVQPELNNAKILSVIRARSVARSQYLPGYEEVHSALATAGLDHTMTKHNLIANAVRIAGAARAFERMLDCYRPRLAFIVCYYSVEGMGFVLACRRRGVPVVDLQHGVQGMLHPAYGGFPKEAGTIQLLPDWFWVWSDEEVSAIHAWAGEGGAHRAIVGGNPWLTQWRQMSEEFVRVTDASILDMRRGFSSKVALVTLQPGLSSLEHLTPLAELMRVAGERWAWWIRLHPRMLSQREEVRSLLLSTGCRFELDRASDLPLYGLLRHVNAHLTHSSSTVIEAEKFGVSSLITSVYGADLYPAQLNRGTARFVDDSPERMLDALESIAAARFQPALTTDLTLAALESLSSVFGSGSRAAA